MGGVEIKDNVINDCYKTIKLIFHSKKSGERGEIRQFGSVSILGLKEL